MTKALSGILVAVMAVLVLGIPDARSEAVKVRLWEDPETGLVYTRPGDGRVQVEVDATVDEGATVAAKTEASAPAEKPAKEAAWYDGVKFKADLRLRYDLMDTQGKESRHRGRYRVRLGAELPVNEMFKLALGITSGEDDPKSANQTFGPSFERGDLRLSHAYATFTPFDWLEIRGGQMENPLYTASDAVWDKDIKPTGGSVSVEHKLADSAGVFMNSGIFVIQHEKSSPRDPFMWVLQPGIELDLGAAELKMALAYYGYEALQFSALTHSPGSNTMINMGGASVLAYDYDGLVFSSALALDTGLGFMPHAKLFGEYAYCFDPATLNQGYIIGMAIGDKKIKNFGDWELAYSWRRMERDSVLDILPDSDAFSGRTNITGHEFIAKFGLYKHVSFGADYYILRDITTNMMEDRVQLDFIFSY